jgi:hypothetical protein
MGMCCTRSTEPSTVNVPEAETAEQNIKKLTIDQMKNKISPSQDKEEGGNYLIDDNSILITSQVNENVNYNVKYKPRKK